MREFIVGIHTAREAHRADDFNPSYPAITTITIEMKLNRLVDLSEFEKFMKYPSTVVTSLGKVRTWAPKDTTKNTFRNQFTITSNDSRRVRSALVFKNGNIKVTGVEDEHDGQDVAFQFEQIFSRFFDVSRINMEDLHYSLINAKVRLNRTIAFDKLADYIDHTIRGRPDFHAARCNFNRSPARNFVLTVSGKRVTFCCYSTGTIMIQGASTIKNLVESYDILLDMFENNRHILGGPSEKVEKMDMFRGYQIDKLFSVLSLK